MIVEFIIYPIFIDQQTMDLIYSIYAILSSKVGHFMQAISYFSIGIIVVFMFHVLVEFLLTSSSFLFLVVYVFDHPISLITNVEIGTPHK